jgi:hypothetical protein
MVRTNEEYLSNSLTYVYQPEIGQRTKYTTQTGQGVVSTANANLDGTGTLATVVQAASTNGALIKTITLKARVTTTRGMVRLYIEDGAANKDIIAEIEIPACNQVTTQESFAISMNVDYMLKYQYYLKASTENAQRVVVTAETLDLSFP